MTTFKLTSKIKRRVSIPVSIFSTGERQMNMTAIKLNAQDSPDVNPLKSLGSQGNVGPLKNVSQGAEQPARETGKITSQEVKEVLEAFQDMSETIQTKLGFSVHEANNEIVIKVFDKASNELIRQFPSDEMLSLQEKMSDLAGFLLNANA